MKKTTMILVSCAFMALTACEIDINDGDTIQGSGKIKTENRTASTFNAVENESPFNVLITATGDNAIEVEADENIIDQVVTLVENNTLIIRTKSRSKLRFSSRKTPVVINVKMPNLVKLHNSGSGDVEMIQLHNDNLEVQNDGSGDIIAKGVSKDLSVRGNGSGDINMRQLKAHQVDIEINGSGDVEIANIDESINVSINGSGDFIANKINTKEAKLSITGSGDMMLEGTTNNLKVEVHGSGNLDGTRLQADNLEIRNSSSGDINFKKLGGTISIDNSGSGSFDATLDNAGQILIQSDGSGTISLNGTGNKLNAKLNSSGDLEAKGLVLEFASVKVQGSGEAHVNVKSAVKVNNDDGDSKNSRVISIDRNGVVN